MAQEDERRLLSVDDSMPMDQMLTRTVILEEQASSQTVKRPRKAAMVVLTAGVLVLLITGLGMMVGSSAPDTSAQQDVKSAVDVKDSQQLYDPWVQKCYTQVHGSCDCNCQWAHQGGLVAAGCGNLDGSCCHACCCGDRVYREAHSFMRVRFDCEADYHDWRRAWSVSKKDFCCRSYGRGCWTDHRGADMNLMQSTYHDDGYRRYDNQPRIRYNDHAQYDCYAGYSRWRRAWSYGKKDYCCRYYQRGCAINWMWIIFGCCVAALVAIGLAAVCFNANKKP